MSNALYEKTGNTWWVKCSCEMWFPASEHIVRHATVKMVCPRCAKTFDAKGAADIVGPTEAG
jgi:hypothetical protein